MLLIINNHDSFTYNLVDLLRRIEGLEMQVCDTENVDLDRVADFSHLLISPGPDVPSVYPQLFEVLHRYHQQKSILGVCLGHQTLCQFFGGELYNLAQIRHGRSAVLRQTDDSLLFKNLPQSFKIGLYHSWAIKNLPPCLQATAVDQDGTLMAMQHRTLPIFGVQFHPESFITEHGEQMLRNWLAS
ncbi:anthranilate synthase component II [Testudinibacter sp. TR-2022]|uniref:anthranilate synthase component II n=1 Tax=Testudinibacter sp. TR-2022 TaxID=2585029 RepID=UPI00111A72C0|nr:anthranilate synthase component II [Testudinibacter sp. TR-2022]TNH07899.1 anthranilate synthase component II [Pasteurellaceae bacterium Phil11]TNH20951.1 anthranilate synthase component II [Testudinibacter sp. TR-2022]TNH28177.1 anthranilate synthase component II [Testudinibacter sp. TR-2022]